MLLSVHGQRSKKGKAGFSFFHLFPLWSIVLDIEAVKEIAEKKQSFASCRYDALTTNHALSCCVWAPWVLQRFHTGTKCIRRIYFSGVVRIVYLMLPQLLASPSYLEIRSTVIMIYLDINVREIYHTSTKCTCNGTGRMLQLLPKWWPHTPVACMEVATLLSRLPWTRESQWIGCHGMRPLVSSMAAM